MKFKICLLFSVAATLFVSANLARGNITNITAYADSDGAIVCPTYSWPDTSLASIYGDQHGSPGHILFNVATDSLLDPILTLNNVIDNDTGFAWADYQINILMNKTFNILNPSISLPPGWSLQSFTPTATQVGSDWVGHMQFGGPSPINPGGVIFFTYSLQFAGPVFFTQEMIPTAVPEPAALSLLLGGGLLLGLVRRQQR